MDRVRGSSGGWTCAVKRREKQRRYWNQADGGYIARRHRHLAEQRARITARLTDLEQEAKRLAQP